MNHYYTILPKKENQNEDTLTNQRIKADAGITSNWKYRQYIQQNANQIMKFNTMQSITDSGNNPYSILNKVPIETSSPHLYHSTHDSNHPSYGFRNSDLKQDYIKKEQMKSRMVSPSIHYS